MTEKSPQPDVWTVMDLGKMAYTQALARQQQAHQQVQQGHCRGYLLLVEHPPVITLSRRKSASEHLIANETTLQSLGIEIQPTDRGGDITYHGPGQLVAYPILRLLDFQMNIGRYMRLLETIVIDLLKPLGLVGVREPGNTGVWVDHQKICAMGVRIRRGVSMHGLALNVNPDLSHFKTIVPCGLADRQVTSIHQCLGDQAPSMDPIKTQLIQQFEDHLNITFS